MPHSSHLVSPVCAGRVIGDDAQRVAVWYEEEYWSERYNFTLRGRDLHSHKKAMRARNEYREATGRFASAKSRYLDCQEEFGESQRHTISMSCDSGTSHDDETLRQAPPRACVANTWSSSSGCRSPWR